MRAWSILLNRREDCVNHVDDSCLWPVAQASLSYHVITVVKKSQEFVAKPVSANVGPHQFRKIAASLGFYFFKATLRNKLLHKRMGSSSMTVWK